MALCYDAGYTMLSMYIMIVMSNITYRFGVNAVWINGIERGIRYVVELVGWLAFAGASAHLGEEATSILYGGVAVAVVLTVRRDLLHRARAVGEMGRGAEGRPDGQRIG